MKEENKNMEAEVIAKNNKSKKTFIIGAVIILIVLGFLIYFGYKKLNSNPVEIYKQAINNTYDSLSEVLKEAEKSSINDNEPYNVKFNAKLDSNMEELKNFVGYNYSATVGIDPKKENISVDLVIDKNNSRILKILLAVINNKGYLKSEELYNKVLSLGDVDLTEEGIELNSINVNYDDIDYVLKSLKNIVIDSLDKDKFDIKNDKITIDSKEYSVKKVLYKLDNDNMKRTSKYVVDKMLQDKKLMEILSDLSGKDVSEVESSLKDGIKEIDSEDYKTIDVVLYATKLNEVIAGSLIEDSKEYIKFDNVKNNININFKDEEDEIEIKVNIKEDIVTINVINAGAEVAKLVMTGDDENIKCDYEINYQGKISGTLEFKNVKSSKDSGSGDFVFTINAGIMGQNINLKLDGNYSVNKGDIETLDPNESVDINSLSENDLMSIYAKLGSILEQFGLSDLLNS